MRKVDRNQLHGATGGLVETVPSPYGKKMKTRFKVKYTGKNYKDWSKTHLVLTVTCLETGKPIDVNLYAKNNEPLYMGRPGMLLQEWTTTDKDLAVRFNALINPHENK